MKDDRAAVQPTGADIPDGGSGSSGSAVADGNPAPEQPAAEPATAARLRAPRRGRDTPSNLRASFRAVPAAGIDRLAPRPPNPRPAGSTLQPAPPRPDLPPAPAPSPDHPARRDAAVPPVADAALAERAAQSKGQGGAGGRVRGRQRAGGQDASGQAAATTSSSTSGTTRTSTAKKQAASGEVGGAASATPPQPVAPKYIPTESERQDARRLFRQIGQDFNRNRKRSRTAAYSQYRHDLMENMDTLIMGGAVELKELTTLITNLEALTKETEAESTETPAAVLGRWLRMAPGEVRELERGEPGKAAEVDDDDEAEPDEAAEDEEPAE